jgi:hypothetical protein
VAADHTVMWQRIGLLTGQVWQTWSNDCLTSVTMVGELNGATWPSHGLPRGTPSLVVVVKGIWTPPESNL